MNNLGAADIDSRLEEQLIDGILYAFQEQTQEVSVIPLLQNASVSGIACSLIGGGSFSWLSYSPIWAVLCSCHVAITYKNACTM